MTSYGRPEIRRSIPWILALAVVLVATPSSALKKKWLEAEELFNPLLGPEYSHWLVGPIYHMATEAEVETFNNLIDDAEAEEFIAAFWKKRNEGTPPFTDTPEQVFENRAIEADKQYSEGAYPGRRTDRGTIFILYGKPNDIEFETPRRVGDPTKEAWLYDDAAGEGLDGEEPKKRIRFVKVGERTVLFTGQKIRRDPREELKRRQRSF